jgi:preprotein translocase SecF subunit
MSSWWPLIKLIPKQTNLKFVSFAVPAGTISLLLVLASFGSMLSAGFRENPIQIYQEAPGGPAEKVGAILAKGFNLGIDFKGGTLVEMEAPAAIDVGAVREQVSGMGLGDVQVQSFGDVNHALIRFESPEGSNPALVVDQVKAELREVVSGVTFTRTEVVGPKVSGELFTSGLMALGVAILLMLVYIWFRFEWQFGLGAVLGLFHDVILTMGLFSFLRLEFTLTIIAALLTIIGYSMNDTVVVFDRMRENLRKYKKKSLADVVDLSVNETLSRTIMTGVTTLMALGGLMFLGGDSLFGFAFACFFGIVIGTYSSVYVAAPAVLIWGVKRGEGEPKRYGTEGEPEAEWPKG